MARAAPARAAGRLRIRRRAAMMLVRRLCHAHRMQALLSRCRCSHSTSAAAAAASHSNVHEVVARLYERELLKDCTDPEALTRLLACARGSVKAYLGFDPTAPSLHVGHLIGLRLLLQLQTAGLPAIALVGGVTAVVGDPSGRSSARNALPPEAVQHNAQRLHEMLRHLLRCGEEEPMVLDNSAWLEDLRVTDLLTGAGRHMRIGAMLSKENVRTRLVAGGAGLSFAEFAYPLLQGYDWVHLARTHNCRVQIGGSDQWGNLVDGAGLVRHMLDNEEHRDSGAATEKPNASETDIVGLTCPLLVDSTGAKLGKSGGNAVWLDADLTSPYELYQYFRRLDTATADVLLKQLTDVHLEEAAELVQAQEANAGGAAASEKLAEEVVSWVHGSEAATAAAHATAALYAGSTAAGANAECDARTAAAALAHALVVGGGGGGATASLSRADVLGAQLLDVCARAGLTKSKGEARRLLTAGGLSCNEERCDPNADIKRVITETDLLQLNVSTSDSEGQRVRESGHDLADTSSVLLLRAGKKKHLLITLT